MLEWVPFPLWTTLPWREADTLSAKLGAYTPRLSKQAPSTPNQRPQKAGCPTSALVPGSITQEVLNKCRFQASSQCPFPPRWPAANNHNYSCCSSHISLKCIKPRLLPPLPPAPRARGWQLVFRCPLQLHPDSSALWRGSRFPFCGSQFPRLHTGTTILAWPASQDQNAASLGALQT